MSKDLDDDYQQKNILLQAYENVPIPEVGRSKRKNITKEDIQDLAREKRKSSEVLQFLPFTPPYIHKLQLLLHINKEYYKELQQTENPVNKAKCHEDIIGRRYVTYTYSPDGVVEVAIRSNDTPFSIATDEDVSIIFSFLGQVKDRILFHLSDPRERAVPSIMYWTLKACDLNKDILINDKAQITLPDIQLRLANRVFRSYVKIMEDKTYYRLEESLTLNQILPEALDNITHPYKSVENKVDQLSEQVSRLYNSMNMILVAMNNRMSFEKPVITNGIEK